MNPGARRGTCAWVVLLVALALVGCDRAKPLGGMFSPTTAVKGEALAAQQGARQMALPLVEQQGYPAPGTGTPTATYQAPTASPSPSMTAPLLPTATQTPIIIVNTAIPCPTLAVSQTPGPCPTLTAPCPCATIQPCVTPVSQSPCVTAVPCCPCPAPTSPCQVVNPCGPRPCAPQGRLHHVVRCGDTLFSISRLYGVSVQALVQVNGLIDPNRIFIGQVLVIP